VEQPAVEHGVELPAQPVEVEGVGDQELGVEAAGRGRLPRSDTSSCSGPTA
jgi:hypothetical protein